MRTEFFAGPAENVHDTDNDGNDSTARRPFHFCSFKEACLRKYQVNISSVKTVLNEFSAAVIVLINAAINTATINPTNPTGR